MSAPIEIESVQRLALNPGDTLIVKLPRPFTAAMAAAVRDRIQHHLPGQPVLVIDNLIELATLGPDTEAELKLAEVLAICDKWDGDHDGFDEIRAAVEADRS